MLFSCHDRTLVSESIEFAQHAGHMRSGERPAYQVLFVHTIYMWSDYSEVLHSLRRRGIRYVDRYFDVVPNKPRLAFEGAGQLTFWKFEFEWELVETSWKNWHGTLDLICEHLHYYKLFLPEVSHPRLAKLPFPQIVVLSSTKYWSSFTVLLSPLTSIFHSAWAFPRSTTRMAANQNFIHHSIHLFQHTSIVRQTFLTGRNSSNRPALAQHTYILI